LKAVEQFFLDRLQKTIEEKNFETFETAFRQPENAKKGVIVVEGRMVERLHLGRAERTVQTAEQIRDVEAACT
jgi:hypothetical protein